MLGLMSQHQILNLILVYSTTSDATTQKLIHLRTDGTAGYASRGLFVKIGREGAYDNSAAHYDIVGSAGNSGTHIFENNGSESMRIDSSGFVGIWGTPNGSAGYGSLSLNGSSGTQSGYLAFIDSSGNLDARIFVDNTVMNIQADPGSATSGSAIAFRTDSSEAMRIDSSGRLVGWYDYCACHRHCKLVESNRGWSAYRAWHYNKC